MLDKFLTLKIGDFGFARAGDQVSQKKKCDYVYTQTHAK